jgi:hypothetical protein
MKVVWFKVIVSDREPSGFMNWYGRNASASPSFVCGMNRFGNPPSTADWTSGSLATIEKRPLKNVSKLTDLSRW